MTDTTAPVALAAGRQHRGITGRYAQTAGRLAFWSFTLVTAAIVVEGFRLRSARYISAEHGVGYALGIIGASLMLLLLVYPLRKRWRWLHGFAQVKTWFRMHMILGIVGPVCILFHSNFHLGSPNSSIALFAMLLVVASGLVGRYLYGKTHFGLYGQQVRLRAIREDLADMAQAIGQLQLPTATRDALNSLLGEGQRIAESQASKASARKLLRDRRRLRRLRHQTLACARSASGVRSDPAVEQLRRQCRTLAGLLERMAGLRLFERLFSVWHVVHLPIFVLMLITAIAHVIVVHWY